VFKITLRPYYEMIVFFPTCQFIKYIDSLMHIATSTYLPAPKIKIRKKEKNWWQFLIPEGMKI